MSKNQIFTRKLKSKNPSPSSTILRKKTPTLSSSQEKVLKSCYFPTYSLSKNRESSLSNSRIDIAKSFTSQESDPSSFSLVKKNTQSTESYSGRYKEINILETKISSINVLKPPKEQFQELQEAWSELAKVTKPISTALLLIQNKTVEYVKYLENQISAINADKIILEETDHSLSILKKRFKKLAIENLETSNLLKEKNHKCDRLKERIKNLKSKLEDELAEKDRINFKLQDFVADFREKMQKKKRKISILKQHFFVLKKIIKLVKNSASDELKTKVLNLSKNLPNFNSEISSSVESNIDLLNPPSSVSKFCSFFSNAENTEVFLLPSLEISTHNPTQQ